MERQLVGRLNDHLRVMTGRSTGEAEKKSWRRSLPILARDLVEADLGKVEMLIEYQLPRTSKRADVVLAGVDRMGNDRYVVVELKQWSQAELFEDNENLVLVPGYRREVEHPLLQVKDYCDTIVDFIGALHGDPDTVRGVAYLHNAADPDVHDLFDLVQSERTRLFTKTRRGAFLDYLRSQFAAEPGAGAADRLLDSAVRPSKQLMRLAAAEIKDREQFILLDEQRVAYEMVLHAVRKAHEEDRKRIVIVTGGPGSGKSVIALSLLGELNRRGNTVLHATGSRSFTQTMRRHVGKGNRRVQNLFKYFNSFMDAEKNELDVLICDEAHRIRQTSANRYTRAAQRTGRPQVDELIAAARVPVFLLDEHQVVKPGETGTLEAIKSHAETLGFRVHHVPLEGQWRCGGSRKYEDWVLKLLGIDTDDDPEPWSGDDHFEVSLAESPAEMEAVLRGKMREGYSARISAGYCWPWSNPRADDTLVPDVRIDGWARPWNVKSDRAVGTAPASALWATSEGGFEQVGCVYTAQGFEYDWSGVILGPDLVARNGRLVTVRDRNKDPELTKRSVSDLQIERHIRNIYKVLLTRGMAGTVIYAVDRETQEFLADLIERRTERVRPA
ncbi:DUF2075 domain-containing protein [Actinomadura sp. HBU206391]|uniref:DUF2075 domain-containing protein n=1 Tax=Actinomadura sp. HBU206391 TaxID=2731692 RepID=UPI0021C7E504|nr:DUF2075 domain-containing protein [Actinomadura sp. HBU206391]